MKKRSKNRKQTVCLSRLKKRPFGKKETRNRISGKWIRIYKRKKGNGTLTREQGQTQLQEISKEDEILSKDSGRHVLMPARLVQTGTESESNDLWDVPDKLRSLEEAALATVKTGVMKNTERQNKNTYEDEQCLSKNESRKWCII